jgi:hypothetical protein
MTLTQNFDRESAIEYCNRQSHVMKGFTFNYDGMSDEKLAELVKLIKSFIRDFPNDYQER